jgi:NADH-quinone oxidoreductase subunit L
MLFLAFHGTPRFDTHGHDDAAHAKTAEASAHAHDRSSSTGEEPTDPHDHASGPPKESPWVVTVPLILLAIPSIYTGWLYIEPMLFGDYFAGAIVVRESHAVLAELKDEWHGAGAFMLHGLTSAPFWLAVAGIAAAAYCYLVNPALPERLKRLAGGLYTLLDNKYYFDKFNDWFFAGGARAVGDVASSVGDRRVIDGFFVNGSARAVQWASSVMREIQTGKVYHYAFTMIVGVVALLTWWAVR